MKTRNYLLTILVGVSMCACSSEDILEQEEKTTSILLKVLQPKLCLLRVRMPLRKHLTVMILQKELQQEPRTLFHLLMIFIMIFLVHLKSSFAKV